MRHHGAGLRRLGTDADLIQRLATNPLSAELAEADKALVAYAVQLTSRPESVSESDVDSLKQAGFGDRAIHDACQVVAYFAYVNRVADGLGVELEERFEE